MFYLIKKHNYISRMTIYLFYFFLNTVCGVKRWWYLAVMKVMMMFEVMKAAIMMMMVLVVLFFYFREPERRSWLFTSESARAFQRVSRAAHQRAAIKATNERHCKSRPLYSNDDDTRCCRNAAASHCLVSFSTYSSIYYYHLQSVLILLVILQ